MVIRLLYVSFQFISRTFEMSRVNHSQFTFSHISATFDLMYHSAIEMFSNSAGKICGRELTSGLRKISKTHDKFVLRKKSCSVTFALTL